jgi:hypothetical protein
MPRIPRSEQTVGVSATQQPFSVGDGYAAPGKALAHAGEQLVSLARHLERQDEELSMFEGQNAYQEFVNAEEQRRRQADVDLTGDGRGHVEREDLTTEQRFDAVRQRFADRPSIARRLELQYGRDRRRWGGRSFEAQQGRIAPFYTEQADRHYTTAIQPNLVELVPESGASVEAQLDAVSRGGALVDQWLDGAAGLPPSVRDSIRLRMRERLFAQWLLAAGPEAAVAREEVARRLQLRRAGVRSLDELEQPSDMMLDADRPPAERRPRRGDPQVTDATPRTVRIARGQDLAQIIPIQAGPLGTGPRGNGVAGLSPAYVSSLARLLAAMPSQHLAQLEIASAHRSGAYQAELHQRHLQGGPLAAPPGQSRHEFGEAVDFAPRGGYANARNNPAYQAALRWLYANSERFGLVNPRSIRRNDPHHFELVPGARQGPGDPVDVTVRSPTSLPVRLAQAGNIVTDATTAPPITTEQLVWERIVGSPVQIEERALRERRALDVEERREAREERDTIERNLFAALAIRMENLRRGEPPGDNGGLTHEMLQPYIHRIRPSRLWALQQLLDPQRSSVSLSNPEVYSDFMLALRANQRPPQVIIDEATDAFRNRQLTTAHYNRILSLAQRNLTPENRTPPWVTDSYREVRRSLLPSGGATEEQRQTYNRTLDELSDYVDRERAAQTLDQKALGEFTTNLITRHRQGSIDTRMRQLASEPRPRALRVAPDAATLDDVANAAAQTRMALGIIGAAGPSPNLLEITREAHYLRRLQEVLLDKWRLQNPGRDPPAPRITGPAAPAAPQAPPAPDTNLPPLEPGPGWQIPPEAIPPGRRSEAPSPQRTAVQQPRRRVRRLLKDESGDITGMEETEEAAPA